MKKINICDIMLYVRIKDCDIVKKMIYLLFLLMFFPIRANAIHEVIDSRCTNSLKLSLREEGQGVVYRLSKTTNGTSVSYTAYFYNLTQNMNMIDSNGKIYTDSRIENLKPGSTFVVNLYASNQTYCEGYKISSKIISVPYYNPYFGSELCNGYENYSLCKEDVNVTISQSEFEKKLNAYKESLNEKENTEVLDEVVEEDAFSLYDFVMSYKYYLIGSLLAIVLAAIIIVLINRRKSGGIL